MVNELLQKNVGRKAISNHLLMEKLRARGAPEPELLVDQVQSINELLSMRFSPDGQMKEKAKAARFLISRGFEPEEVEAAIERYFVK